MANNKIQVKRTSVSGRTANVTSSGNSQYIDAGELALNMADGILYSSNGSTLITVGSNLVNQNISGNLTVNAVIANGSLGTSGQVLTTNSTGVYWSNVSSGGGSGTVTSVDSGSGLTGGPITNSGTLSVLANNGIIANSSGTFVNANTGLVVNTAGVFVNSDYIATLTANNTSFVGTVSAANVVSNAQLSSNLSNYQTTSGLSANVATLTANNTSFVGTVSAANVVSNAQLSANLSNYQTTAGLSANVATLTANNANNLGGVAAASYVQNTDSRTLSGNLVFSGANVNFTNGVVTFSSTDAIKLPAGTAVQRPTGVAGQIRFNSDTNQFEGFNGVSWGTIGGTGGASGGGTDDIFYENSKTVTTNYSITTNKNAMSTGPVTVSNGVVVTIPSGSRWVVI